LWWISEWVYPPHSDHHLDLGVVAEEEEEKEIIVVWLLE
jgi:hypothetical protein